MTFKLREKLGDNNRVTVIKKKKLSEKADRIIMFVYNKLFLLFYFCRCQNPPSDFFKTTD